MSVYRETANVALFNKLACTQVNIADCKIFYVDGTINWTLTYAEEWSVNAPRAVPTTLHNVIFITAVIWRKKSCVDIYSRMVNLCVGKRFLGDYTVSDE